MTYPNILVFVDFPTDDVDAANDFYSKVFNWEIEERIPGIFHRIVPGQNFKLDDGSQGPTGNLHMGISKAANTRPHPNPEPPEPTTLSPGGRSTRAWILVSEDDSFDRILDTAESLGATVLWRNHFWTEFGGANASFIDPWGNQINLWQHLEGVEVDEETHQVIGEALIPDGWTIE
ncbi:MAG: glyoxalase [Acidimicrobiaceae bacterium]|uniref:VOC domain-containing protein n=1 Tax=marine metagenome TaxID=408172 RepID=A0A382HVK4_9ZZZZ|nr:glyoxalase [Acidimicrobiaceae bacterium]